MRLHALTAMILIVFTTPLALAGTYPVAFVTSVQGPGNLSTWPEAGGRIGLDAGDAICSTLAARAGLDNPQAFVAWLSDTADDAYCRVHGMTGTVANRCGQPELPRWAGPWVRTDGHPFSHRIDRMLGDSGVVFVPLGLDEEGEPTSTTRAIFTGTGDTGQLRLQSGTTAPCGDWRSSAHELATAGSRFATTHAWTQVGSGFCEFDRAIYCFEVGSGPNPVIPHQQGARVFYSRTSTYGDFGGPAEADRMCQEEAAAEGLAAASSFKAWISDDNVDARDRFTWPGPWIRTDGVVAVESLDELASGHLTAPINVDSQGHYSSVWWAWTGTRADGTASGDTCGDWHTDTLEATAGTPETSNASWTDWLGISLGCWVRAGFYCFAQEEEQVLFGDGFESGGLAGWDGSQGG